MVREEVNINVAKALHWLGMSTSGQTAPTAGLMELSC